MTTTVPPGDEVPRGGATRRRAEIVCVTAIAVKTVFALALLPLAPSLLGTDPVLLEALRGSTSAMASGGAFARVGEVSLVLAVLAPLPTLLFATPFFWWAGRLWGPKAAAVLGGGHPKARSGRSAPALIWSASVGSRSRWRHTSRFRRRSSTRPRAGQG
jgi:hypothetical protein